MALALIILHHDHPWGIHMWAKILFLKIIIIIVSTTVIPGWVIGYAVAVFFINNYNSAFGKGWESYKSSSSCEEELTLALSCAYF